MTTPNENIETVEEMNNEQYIAAIEELKSTTVSKDSYNKLRAENKRLLDSLVSGKDISVEAPPKPTVDELRKKLFFSGEIPNLEYMETALLLRDSLIEAGERDPFLPVGDKVTTTSDHYVKTQTVTDGLRDMVDFTQGDRAVFNAEYQRRVKDSALTRRR